VWINNEVPHADVTVEISLFCSLIAVCVTFFNVIMIQPNEFDPIVIEYEFLKREQEDKIKAEKDET
jgi:hypothetical protein